MDILYICMSRKRIKYNFSAGCVRAGTERSSELDFRLSLSVVDRGIPFICARKVDRYII